MKFLLTYFCFTLAGLAPYDEEPSVRSVPELVRTCSCPDTRQRREVRCKHISFDDYHKLWKGLATSVSAYSTKDNQCRCWFNVDECVNNFTCAFCESQEIHVTAFNDEWRYNSLVNIYSTSYLWPQDDGKLQANIRLDCESNPWC